MLFNSTGFLLFFPVVVLLYFLLPDRLKCFWLLLSSYYFYMCWNAKYALLLLTSTAVTYACGLLLARIERSHMPSRKGLRAKKYVVALSLIINLAILFFFKYANYSLSLFSRLLAYAGSNARLPSVDVLLPVGISFYTFQALGYTIDVYRGEIDAERNFFRYALFVSFFPQLVAGPIERSKSMLGQLSVPQKFRFHMARDGFLLMLWGYFLKIVLADRIAVYVDTVYGNYSAFPGYYLVVGSVLFAFQIYCDFAGYSTIAVGAAEILGIQLTENFDAPYLSLSVSEFWRKWHISLTSWFRDYLYIPLGGSRKGRRRSSLNKLIVFLLSGLWHGASSSFVIWGGLNGLYLLIGNATRAPRDKLVSLLHLNRNSLGHKLMQCLFTFILVDFAWVFFRAGSTSAAFRIIGAMLGERNPWILFDGSLYRCGLDQKNWTVLLLSLGLLLFVDLCKHKGIKIREVIVAQDPWFRWVFIAVAVCLLLTFGIWGPSYNAANFIYFQF